MLDRVLEDMEAMIPNAEDQLRTARADEERLRAELEENPSRRDPRREALYLRQRAAVRELDSSIRALKDKIEAVKRKKQEVVERKRRARSLDPAS